jgi:hypothetical protein
VASENKSEDQQQLERMGNVNKNFRETLGLEIAKRVAGSSVRI